MTYAIIALLVVAGLWLVSYLQGNPRFWHLAAKYPQEAYAWFTNDPAWIVVDAAEPDPDFPEGRSAYAGPFMFFEPRSGRCLRIYGRADAIEFSEARFLASLKDAH